MASRTITTLIDDLDGSTATETVTFALDGVTYEIDLSAGNALDLRNALAPWIAAGRRVGASTPARTRTAGTRAAAARDRTGQSALRTWARANGWPQLAKRGRIPADAKAAYAATIGAQA